MPPPRSTQIISGEAIVAIMLRMMSGSLKLEIGGWGRASAMPRPIAAWSSQPLWPAVARFTRRLWRQPHAERDVYDGIGRVERFLEALRGARNLATEKGEFQ